MIAQKFADTPDVIRESSSHRRSTGRADVLGFAQLMMRETEIVRASDQIHPRLKRSQATGRVTRFAGQARQSFAKGSIQALDKRRVEDAASLRLHQQFLRLRQQTMSHAPRDLDDPFFLRALDHRANVQLRPDLQARSSHPRSSLDLLAERSADTARIGAPAIGQHEQGAQARRASAHLGHQAVSQAAITRELDHPTTGGSKPSWPVPSTQSFCTLSPESHRLVHASGPGALVQ